MENNNTQTMIEYTEGKSDNYRWITVTTLLLAIGTIMRMVSPSVGGVTPNWMIAMYCIAIILIRPSLGRAAGIGVVAGALEIPFSKSAFPYGNLLAEPVGAVICALIAHSTFKMTLGSYNIRPAVAAFLSTVASGMTFITVLKFVLALPLKVYLYVLIPVVFSVAGLNMIIAQLLYFPAQKLFNARGDK